MDRRDRHVLRLGSLKLYAKLKITLLRCVDYHPPMQKTLPLFNLVQTIMRGQSAGEE